MHNGSVDKDTKWLAWCKQQFTEIAGENGQIDLDEF